MIWKRDKEDLLGATAIIQREVIVLYYQGSSRKGGERVILDIYVILYIS